MKIGVIAANTFREAVRNRVLYTVVFFALLLTVVSAFFGTVSIGSQVQVIKSFGLFSLSFFSAVITILSGVSLLHKELKQKTIYNILSKPVSRWQFLLGKYFGLVLTVQVLSALMGFAMIAFVSFFERRVDWALFQGVFFVFLETAVLAAVTMFFSSIAVTVTLTGLFALGTYLAGRSINYLGHFLREDQGYPAAVARAVPLLDAVLPDFSVFNVSNALVYGIPISPDYILSAVCYCLCYSAAALTVSVLIFSRRELL